MNRITRISGVVLLVIAMFIGALALGAGIIYLLSDTGPQTTNEHY